MEYISGGTLISKIKKGEIKDPKKYIRDIIKGLEYCHEIAGIIHRDLKPENFLIDENDNIKIVDFGMSLLTTEGDQEINDPGGSAYFLAPEICKGLSYKGKQSDIWALGINIFYICFGKLPFTANSVPDLFVKIINQE